MVDDCDMDNIILKEIMKPAEALTTEAKGWLVTNQQMFYYNETKEEKVFAKMRLQFQEEQAAKYAGTVQTTEAKQQQRERMMNEVAIAGGAEPLFEPVGKKDKGKGKARQGVETAEWKQFGSAVTMMMRHPHEYEVVLRLLAVGSHFRQDLSLMRISELNKQFLGIHGGVSEFILQWESEEVKH